MLEFSELILENVTLELRFNDGYSYWDNCGRIWWEIIQLFSGSVKVETVNTDNAVIIFDDDKENIKLSFSPNNIIYSATDPIFDIECFKSFVNNSISILCEQMKISDFTRIGHRFIFVYPCQVEEIDEYISQINRVVDNNQIAAKILTESEEKIKRKEFVVRYETEDFGFRIVTCGGKKGIRSRYPRSFVSSPTVEKCVIKKDQHLFVVDFDFYTLKALSITNYDAVSFFNSVYEKAERYLLDFLR